jgi:hypothetical protein
MFVVLACEITLTHEFLVTSQGGTVTGIVVAGDAFAIASARTCASLIQGTSAAKRRAPGSGFMRAMPCAVSGLCLRFVMAHPWPTNPTVLPT